MYRIMYLLSTYSLPIVLLAVDSSVASSAPIWQFTGMTDCNDFNNLVSSVYNETSANCFQNIRRSWDVMIKLAKNTSEKSCE